MCFCHVILPWAQSYRGNQLWKKTKTVHQNKPFFPVSLFISSFHYCFRRLTLLSNQYVLHKHHHLDLEAWSCVPVWKLHAGDASHNELKSSYKCKNLWASALYNLLSIKRVWASALYNYSVLKETVFWFLQDATWHMNEYRHRPHSQIQKTNSLQNSIL